MGPAVALNASGGLGFPAVSTQLQDRGRNGFFLETLWLPSRGRQARHVVTEGLCGGKCGSGWGESRERRAPQVGGGWEAQGYKVGN